MDVEGQHQLLLATRRGDLALVKILVDQGVNPNAQNGVGCTPLMLAAKYCWWKVAQFLLSLHDINLEARCETGWTALVFAAGNGHLKLVKLFRRHDPKELFIQDFEESLFVDLLLHLQL